jgi:hypothetical protein
MDAVLESARLFKSIACRWMLNVTEKGGQGQAMLAEKSAWSCQRQHVLLPQEVLQRREVTWDKRDARFTPERGRPCRVTCILGSRSDGGTRISSCGSQSSRLGRSMDRTDSSSSQEDSGMVKDC